MGQAFDRDGNVLGEAYGETKRAVLEQLEKDHPHADEIRIKSLIDRARATALSGPKDETAKPEVAMRMRPGLSNHESWDALVERLRVSSRSPEPEEIHALYRRFCERSTAERYGDLPDTAWNPFDKGYTQAINDVLALASRSRVHIDDKMFDVPSTLRGSQIKALVGADAGRTLWLDKSPTYWDDELIGDCDVVTIEEGQRFYTLPLWESQDLDMRNSKRYAERVSSRSPEPTPLREFAEYAEKIPEREIKILASAPTAEQRVGGTTLVEALNRIAANMVLDAKRVREAAAALSSPSPALKE